MRAGRLLKLAALGAATLLLAAGAWKARSGLQQLAFEQRQVMLGEARIAAAKNLIPNVEQHERFAQLADQAQAQAGLAGLDASQWAQRRIQRTSAMLSRTEAQEQLVQIGANGKGQLMVAEGFELAVLSQNAGLFTQPAADDAGLMLSINGTVYFIPGHQQ